MSKTRRNGLESKTKGKTLVAALGGVRGVVELRGFEVRRCVLQPRPAVA